MLLGILVLIIIAAIMLVLSFRAVLLSRFVGLNITMSSDRSLALRDACIRLFASFFGNSSLYFAYSRLS